MKLDRARPETVAGVDALARSVNCALIYMDSLYEQAKTQEALAEECTWFLHRLDQSGYGEGRKLVQARLDEHNRRKAGNLLKVKELETQLGAFIPAIANLTET